MLSTRQSLIVCGLLWLAFTALVMFTRPVLPTSETRAMTVAWEMFVRGDFLNMTLNFAPYSHKPPLLPWLIQAMWMLFGVSKAAATIVTACVTFGTAWMMTRLARLLWPNNETIAALSLWLFLGLPLVLAYGHLILYDFLLSLFVVSSMCALVLAATTRRYSAFLLLGACIGLGGLAKGPVVLLHVLPAAVLLPVWAPQRHNMFRWYSGIVLGVLIGFAIALAWAIPAAIRGGPTYAHMIFFGQSTGRIVHAFDHAKPWWFYCALAPLYLLPWLFLPSLWHSTQSNGWQQRFLACWAIPVFIAFSLISGKQIHYLFPILPAVCLWLAARVAIAANKRSLLTTIPLVLCALLGVGLSVAKWAVPLSHTENPFLLSLQDLPVGYGAVIVIVSCALLSWSGRYLRDTVVATSVAVVAIAGWMHVIADKTVFASFDMQPIADVIQAEQNKNPNQAFAYLGTYEGDFGYLARLNKPVDAIVPNDLGKWHQAHPKGLVISCLRNRENANVMKGWTAFKEIPFRSVRTCGLYHK